MKPFEYILKFVYMLAVSLGIGLGVGPLLFQTGLKSVSEDTLHSEIDVLKVDYLNADNTSYLRLNLKLENDEEIEKIISVKEQQHQPLLKYLKEEGLVNNEPMKKWMPLEINALQFNKGRNVNYKWSSDGKIDFFSINGQVIIGKTPTPFKRIILIVIGIIFMGLGLFLLIIGLMLFYQNYKIYIRTGVLPELPNTIENMKEGLRFLFRINQKR